MLKMPLELVPPVGLEPTLEVLLYEHERFFEELKSATSGLMGSLYSP